jgi:hypothetical protein
MRAAFKLLLLAGLAAGPSAAVGQAPPEKKVEQLVDEKPIVVPFELLKSGHMAVQVKVNGKGPYRLIFDTGAPMNLISNKVAKEAGVIDPKGKRPGFSPFGAMGQMDVKTLEIGDVRAEKMQAVVIDHPTVGLLAEAVGPLEGIIGFPFFARHRVTVDYQKKELTFAPNGYQPSDIMQSLQKKIMEASQNKDPLMLAPAAVWGLVVDKDKGDEDAGVVVKEVLAGGPAAAAGIKPGDRLLTIDGRWTDTVGDTFLAATFVKPGRAVEVAVKRGDKEVKLMAKPVKGV